MVVFARSAGRGSGEPLRTRTIIRKRHGSNGVRHVPRCRVISAGPEGRRQAFPGLPRAPNDNQHQQDQDDDPRDVPRLLFHPYASRPMSPRTRCKTQVTAQDSPWLPDDGCDDAGYWLRSGCLAGLVGGAACVGCPLCSPLSLSWCSAAPGIDATARGRQRASPAVPTPCPMTTEAENEAVVRRYRAEAGNQSHVDIVPGRPETEGASWSPASS